MREVMIKTLFGTILLLCSVVLNAQSVRRENGDLYARKTGANTYEPVPAGVVSYVWEGDNVWMLLGGQRNVVKGTIKRKDSDMILYLNQDGNVVAYYAPMQGRYYAASGIGEMIDKDSNYASLQDGTLYDTAGNVWLKVDTDFDPIMLGFFLFLN